MSGSGGSDAPARPGITAREGPIFGVDVHSGDIRGAAPSYALVVLDGETAARSVVSFRKLRRTIAERKPALVATDNVFELAEDKDALIRFLDELPPDTRLVQVTGDERPEPLSRVASRHDVPYDKEPMAEAEAAARLAARNVGFVVRAFTDRTRIKVSRGRSTGKGGWSEDRFTRRIHGAVRRRAREVETALEDAALEYEQEVTEKYGGYANATFTVEATPSALPVSRERSGDVRIEIDRERQDGITFEPLAERRDYVIVGVDPGTTTAVAIVDIDGHLLDVYSTRTDDMAAVIEWIVGRGRPFIVAADVTPMPGAVEKIRRSFDAAGWTPTSDLLIDRKQHRTREVAYDNDHERDAIAAALFAYDDHAHQFERISGRIPRGLERGEVIARVIAEETSVESVVDALTPDEPSPDEPTPEPAPEPDPQRRRITNLTERVERLEEHIEELEGTVERKDDRIAELENELGDRRREERREVRERREVTRLRRESDRLARERDEWKERVGDLEEKLERLKALWRLDHGNFSDLGPEAQGLVPVKPVDKFTREAIEAADRAYGLARNDVILLRDATGAGRETAERLAAIEPRAVIKRGGLTDPAKAVFFEAAIPFGERDDVRVQEIDELAVASESDVEAMIEDWEDRAAARERDRRDAMVDRLISEHRAKRLPDE